MRGLLDDQDLAYLRTSHNPEYADRLRRERRAVYWICLQKLAADLHEQTRVRRLEVGRGLTEGAGDTATTALKVEAQLLRLRFAGFCHALRLPSCDGMVRRSLDSLIQMGFPPSTCPD